MVRAPRARASGSSPQSYRKNARRALASRAGRIPPLSGVGECAGTGESTRKGGLPRGRRRTKVVPRRRVRRPLVWTSDSASFHFCGAGQQPARKGSSVFPGERIDGSSLRVGILLSRVRVEEKLLLAELERRGVEVMRFDDREFTLDLSDPSMTDCDVILERCINHLRALYTLKVLNDWGVPTVNSYEVANICGDKLLTTTALVKAGVPTPRTVDRLYAGIRDRGDRGDGLPCGAQAGGRLVGPAPCPRQRSRRGRGAARAQGHPGLVPPRRVLRAGVRGEGWPRHPGVCDRRRSASARSTATPHTGSPIRPGAARPAIVR